MKNNSEKNLLRKNSSYERSERTCRECRFESSNFKNILYLFFERHLGIIMMIISIVEDNAVLVPENYQKMIAIHQRIQKHVKILQATCIREKYELLKYLKIKAI